MEEANCLEEHPDGLRSRVRFSTMGGQIFVHSAYPTNAADSVFFGPDTVRFVDLIRAYLRSRSKPITRAADIGCGAGPGGITIAAAAPDAAVWNLDINHKALHFARVNAALNGAAGTRAEYSNLMDEVEGSFDLIVSNPPYLIDPQGRAYRHGGGELGEGLSLAILKQAVDRLSPGGSLVLYTGVAIVAGRDAFREACVAMLDGHVEYMYREIDPDVFGEELETLPYCNADRIAAVVLNVTA